VIEEGQCSLFPEELPEISSTIDESEGSCHQPFQILFPSVLPPSYNDDVFDIYFLSPFIIIIFLFLICFYFQYSVEQDDILHIVGIISELMNLVPSRSDEVKKNEKKCGDDCGLEIEEKEIEDIFSLIVEKCENEIVCFFCFVICYCFFD
jgi:hypothetical protein